MFFVGELSCEGQRSAMDTIPLVWFDFEDTFLYYLIIVCLSVCVPVCIPAKAGRISNPMEVELQLVS